MGQIAVDMHKSGFSVSGSDSNLYNPMKEILRRNGVAVKMPFSTENVHQDDIVIIGNAISRGNVELEEVLNRRMTYTSLPELLRLGLLSGRKNLVISGTHGKTTISSLIAYVLASAGLEPGYMIGGAPRNLPAGFSSQGDEWFVIEGDEYDTAFFDKRPKFLQYQPFVVLINNLEYDHSDIYRSLAEIKHNFIQLTKLIPENGFLVVNIDDTNMADLITEARCAIVSFGLNDEADFTCKYAGVNIEISKGGKLWCETRLNLPGEFNVRNALGAAAILDAIGISSDDFVRLLPDFKGGHRRMELTGEARGICIYDDFAHHPTAVRASIRALREIYPDRRIWAIFHPRSNTSVKNIHQPELIRALKLADCAVIAELHRKNIIPPQLRLSREIIRDELIKSDIKAYLWDEPDEILENILPHLKSGDVVLIMSNCDFGGLAGKLLDELSTEGRLY